MVHGAGIGISYVSKTTFEELIELMGKIYICLSSLLRFFSVVVDSTPDVSHVDLLTLILRYTGADGRPVQRFVRFIKLHLCSIPLLSLQAVNKKSFIPY